MYPLTKVCSTCLTSCVWGRSFQLSSAALLQILKDPATRAAYNQQLALAAAQQQVFVSQTISLADMELPSEDSSEHSYATCLQYPCRCGGAYWLDPHSIGAIEDSALLPCDTCSLYVEVCKTCL